MGQWFFIDKLQRTIESLRKTKSVCFIFVLTQIHIHWEFYEIVLPFSGFCLLLYYMISQCSNIRQILCNNTWDEVKFWKKQIYISDPQLLL